MENQSIRSSEKMATNSDKTTLNLGKKIIAGIDDIGEDLMLNILGRLPALSFASAACVSHSWNSLCTRILSSPKLRSAVSFNSSLEDAVNEVVDSVLSEPIRPQFALASVGPSFGLQQAHLLIAKKFGSGIPVITNVSEGIIGRDPLIDKFVEVQWELTDEEYSDEEEDVAVLPKEGVNVGIILTVGFLPGLNTHIVPLFNQDKHTHNQELKRLRIDEFVMDIREHASAFSDSKSPAGIILFADRKTELKPVLQAMEVAFSPETIIIGDGGSKFFYRSHSVDASRRKPAATAAAAALLFSVDKNKPLGIGETKFHVMLSTGLTPVGSRYRVSSVKCYPTSTCLTGSRETLREHLDGQTMLEDVYDELGDRIQYPSFYVGVTKRRKCSVGMEKVRRMQFLEFHEVAGGNEEYLFVNSTGIKTGDPFQFYVSNSKAAMSHCKKLSDNFLQLKQDLDHANSGSTTRADKSEVFGGIIFSCCGRGESFFGQPGIDSAPFLDNFPGVNFGGTYCAGEIGRVNSSFYDQDSEEDGFSSCSQHFYSALYLVMSYRPPPAP